MIEKKVKILGLQHYNLISMINLIQMEFPSYIPNTGPRSAVGNASGYRCEADCRSRGREFDPGPVPYFRGD